jgi:RNA recognition motif-containing protein
LVQRSCRLNNLEELSLIRSQCLEMNFNFGPPQNSETNPFSLSGFSDLSNLQEMRTTNRQLLHVSELPPTNGLNIQPTRLFIGDLSYFCTEENLRSLFSPYQPILEVSIRRGDRGGSLLHGHIVLASQELANLAVANLNNFEFMGRQMV